MLKESEHIEMLEDFNRTLKENELLKRNIVYLKNLMESIIIEWFKGYLKEVKEEKIRKV